MFPSSAISFSCYLFIYLFIYLILIGFSFQEQPLSPYLQFSCFLFLTWCWFPFNSLYFTSKPQRRIYKSVSPLPTKPKVTIIISQDSSQSSKSTIEEQPRTTKKPLSSGHLGKGLGPGPGLRLPNCPNRIQV